MDRRMAQDLDNYITGHYGEDQFKLLDRAPRAYRYGAEARRKNRPVTSCRCKTAEAKAAWRQGWFEESMCIEHNEG